MRKNLLYSLVLLLLFIPSDQLTVTSGHLSPSPPVNYSYRIVQSYPHDPQAFTQGLVYKDGFFYEGTGLHGRSSLRQVDPTDGKVLKITKLPEAYFGEGISFCNDRIIQLTWREHMGFVYDATTFSLLETFTYDTEGWGLTYGGTHLIMSDGSATLTFLDPETFAPVKKLEVKSGKRPVSHLNELEFIKGKVFANVWLTDQIAIIDPNTGQVTAWLDLSGLLDPSTHRGHTVDVLNGIAYDELEDRLFVTGKLWPTVFEIEIIY